MDDFERALFKLFGWGMVFLLVLTVMFAVDAHLERRGVVECVKAGGAPSECRLAMEAQ
jgi:hypothetical protein